MSTVRLVSNNEKRTYDQKVAVRNKRSEEDYISGEELKRRMKPRIKAIFNKK